MEQHESVGGVRAILVRHGQVVLARHWHNQGFWTLPGGMRKNGESLEETARREVFEETGYRINSFGGMLGVYHGRPGKKRDDVAVFYTEDFSGWLRFLPNREIMERGLFSLDRLPKKLSPANRRRIEAFTAGVREERLAW